MKKTVRAAWTLPLIAAALSGCVHTAPSQPTFWNKCDGFAAPEGEGMLLGRASLSAATLGLVWAAPEENKPWSRLSGDGGVAACDEALAHGRLDSFPVRKLNILRARAIHNLEAKKYDAAKADVEAMRAFLPNLQGDQRDLRSAESAVAIVEAVVKIYTDQTGDGEAVIRSLVLERPYSETFMKQMIGLMPRGWVSHGANKPILAALARFAAEPVLVRALDEFRTGEFGPSAIDDWRYVIGHAMQLKGNKAGDPAAAASGKKVVAEPFLYVGGATVAARLGDISQAREWLATGEDILADMGKGELNHQSVKYETRRLAPHEILQLQAMLPQYRKIVDIYEDYFAGRYAEARAPYENKDRLPLNAVTVQQIKLLQKTVPQAERKGFLALNVEGMTFADGNASAHANIHTSVAQLFDILPLWQPYSHHDRYSTSVSFLKETGFKDKKLENGDWNISFIGTGSSRIAIEEMTLLRAAQIAKKNGKTRFEIVEQKNYKRMTTLYVNGVPAGGPTDAGFKTEMEIHLLDGDLVQHLTQVEMDRSFDVAEIIDRLYVLYTARPKKTPRTSNLYK